MAEGEVSEVDRANAMEIYQGEVSDTWLDEKTRLRRRSKEVHKRGKKGSLENRISVSSPIIGSHPTRLIQITRSDEEWRSVIRRMAALV